MDEIIKKLAALNLHNPFPYSDTSKIQEDFQSDFKKLSEEQNCLTGDFNTYCMNIAGSLSYVFAGKSIPPRQAEMLQYSFFEFFKQYKFFEDKIEDYNEFHHEYSQFEEARKLLQMF